MADYEGQVSGPQQRWETDRGKQVLVWDFRIERLDANGLPLHRVPVEMRGEGFDGAINEGDIVRVNGDWAEGKTLHVSEVLNLTTGARVTARGQERKRGHSARWVIGLLFLALLYWYLQLNHWRWPWQWH